MEEKKYQLKTVGGRGMRPDCTEFLTFTELVEKVMNLEPGRLVYKEPLRNDKLLAQITNTFEWYVAPTDVDYQRLVLKPEVKNEHLHELQRKLAQLRADFHELHEVFLAYYGENQ